MNARRWKAVINLPGGHGQQTVYVEATDQIKAREMIFAQYGKNNVVGHSVTPA